MATAIPSIRKRLGAQDLSGLFLEDLGWDRSAPTPIEIQVTGLTFQMVPVAQKRGAVVCVVHSIPERFVRANLERALSKLHFEHIVAYVDGDTGEQVWQWARREPGKPTALKEHWLRRGQSGEALAERLAGLSVTLEEEEDLTLTGVTARLRHSFDAERVTRAFYERFRTEHEAFIEFIDGIAAVADREWYASLMLNRLMFTYFIQKKGFLDGDLNYLRNRLGLVRKEVGADQFLSFYKRFVLRLFHGAFGGRPQLPDAPMDDLIGLVPYLNGGLFDVHSLEVANPAIEIKDEAFSRLFDFFDEYTWHLDDRPLRNDREINPDVLGFIFEKYINQKEMGAYYTKEDVTGYMAGSTVLARVLDLARAKCEIAFEPTSASWALLQEIPDRYIQPSLLYGLDRSPQPQIDSVASDQLDRAADSHLSLPGESWRDYLARRDRVEELRQALSRGDVTSVDGLVTLNLNIGQFTQDVIDQTEGPELIRAIFSSLQSMSVLDPACGSGAFLFAALLVLAPVYDACLDRMLAFLDDPGSVANGDSFVDFRKVLEDANRHPNRDYFILTAIIMRNLYGVDIMEEAVEICKLRLFLKLVSQIDRVEDLEPLPDVDFNIRAGNSLVGFSSLAEVSQAISGVLDFGDTAARIASKAAESEGLFRRFQERQLEGAAQHAEVLTLKAELSSSMDALRAELTGYLAELYGVDQGQRRATWESDHLPFHWCVEFYGTMLSGFDVVIGNPPWREYSRVRNAYTVRGYMTEPSGNLHAFFTERAMNLRAPAGRVSFIVQLPMASSSRMAPVRKLLRGAAGVLHLAYFDDRPGRLFDGLEHCRAVIFHAADETHGEARVLTTKYQRWYTDARAHLFGTLEYADSSAPAIVGEVFPKYGSALEAQVFASVARAADSSLGLHVQRRHTQHFVFYQEATGYWVKAVVGLPFYAKDGKEGPPAHGRYLFFENDQAAHAAAAILNSSLFYAYFIAYSDCFHLSDRLVGLFPIMRAMLDSEDLGRAGALLMDDLKTKADVKEIRTRDGAQIRYAEFEGWRSKPLIDTIDEILGGMYSLTPDEVLFVRNYDVAFRMGDSPAD